MTIFTFPNLIAGLVIAQAIQLFYIITYRLFLSPLAGIPGPQLAAVTSWYEVYYDVWKPAQYVFKIKELHERYGPIVRITPREISISDLNYIDTIYAPGLREKRNKDIEKVKAMGINTSIGGAVSHDLHRKRRESLNPFFSKKSVINLAPRLEAKISQLHEVFADRIGKNNGRINLSDTYFAFSSDIVSEYCFGHNSNALADLTRAASMRKNVATVLRGVKINLQFSWIRSMVRMLPARLAGRWVPQGIKDMIQLRKKIRQEVQQVLDSKNIEGSTNPHSIFYELRDSPSLPDTEKTVQRLEDEAILLIMAGTESTAKSICIAHYHLLANPKIMAKLRVELSTLPNTRLEDIDRLYYVQAIADEANRLSFGLTGRNPRVSPDVALSYSNSSASKTIFNIPPGTPVSTSTLLAHTDESIFPDPWTFDPDRWLGPEGQERKRYMLAYSKGPRMCIGQNLANAELLLTITELAKWDMTLFETDERDVKFLHDYHVATPRLDSLGIRATVVGKND